MLPSGSSLEGLVVSPSTFESVLKWALLTPDLGLFTPFDTGEPHLLPAVLVPCELTHVISCELKHGSCELEKPNIQMVTPGLERGIDLCDLPITCTIDPCNWQDQRKHCLCSWSLNQSPQGPEVSLACPQTFGVWTSSLPTWKNSNGQQWEGCTRQGSFLVTPLTQAQGGSRLPYGLGLVLHSSE